ncbi:MAG: SpoIIE family protein phosphatase [Candidatus Zixiibacteriota bacterium]|nr:MAG: SpoIIE family protein phosphatase [candidate division Zixibacteria bacterium]
MIRIFSPVDKTRYNWYLKKGTYVLGRGQECDLIIKDDTVSRRHAQVEIVDEQTIKLTDLGSHNGTSVNGRMIDSPVVLRRGGLFALGRMELKFATADILKTKDSSLLITDIDEDLTRATSMPIDEALKPLPSKILENPDVFKAVSEIGKMLIVPGEDEEMLDKGLELLQEIIPAERIAVFLTGEQKGEFHLSACYLSEEGQSSAFRISSTILKEILDQKKAILIPDVQSETKYAEQQSIIKSGIKSAMAVPLYDEGRIFGILYADTTNSAHHYTEDCLRVTATFANILAAKLANNNLLNERRAKEILESELAVASQIQEQLLPKSLPFIEGYSMEAFQIQCKQVGGDLYDVAKLDDGRTLFLLADVSGKGMGAALLASNILASFRMLYNTKDFNLLDAICHVSKQLLAFTRPGDFATLFMGLLNSQTGMLQYVNAGHNPPIIIRDNGEVEYLEASGIPIGTLNLAVWEEATLKLNINDLLLVFSDGIPEAEDRHGEQFGDERLEKLALRNPGQSPRELIAAIMNDVNRFIESNPRSDDITMIVLRREG